MMDTGGKVLVTLARNLLESSWIESVAVHDLALIDLALIDLAGLQIVRRTVLGISHVQAQLLLLVDIAAAVRAKKHPE